MTSTEKIANAKKRINELETLIKYWDNSKEKNINKIDIEFNNEQVAA
tara:strand:+ start:315 stop:455 length:141 start_codon:yes stop_codon:yes gene_type:complete